MIAESLNFLSGYVFCAALDFRRRQISWVLMGFSLGLAAIARWAR